MKKGQLDRAERIALNRLDEWLEVTGVVGIDTGYYYELVSIIRDSVLIGVQMSAYGRVHFNEDGEIVDCANLPFGTTVRTIHGAPARSLDSHRCAYIPARCDDVETDEINFNVGWANPNNLPLPSDEQLEKLNLKINQQQS